MVAAIPADAFPTSSRKTSTSTLHEIPDRSEYSIKRSGPYHTGCGATDGIAEIYGLPTVPGHLCHFDQCLYRTTNTDCIRQHYNKRHQWQVSRHRAIPWHQAHLQTLSSQRQAVHYFAVALSDAIPQAGTPYISLHANASLNAPEGSLYSVTRKESLTNPRLLG